MSNVEFDVNSKGVGVESPCNAPSKAADVLWPLRQSELHQATVKLDNLRSLRFETVMTIKQTVDSRVEYSFGKSFILDKAG
jgi:hypothetical protein